MLKSQTRRCHRNDTEDKLPVSVRFCSLKCKLPMAKIVISAQQIHTKIYLQTHLIPHPPTHITHPQTCTPPPNTHPSATPGTQCGGAKWPERSDSQGNRTPRWRFHIRKGGGATTSWPQEATPFDPEGETQWIGASQSGREGCCRTEEWWMVGRNVCTLTILDDCYYIDNFFRLML